MSIIRATGPATEKTPNIINPNDPIKWPEIETAEPITIKPTATPHPPPKPKPLPLLPKSAINVPGEDSNVDYAVKTTQANIDRQHLIKAEGKRWAAIQPRSTGKIFDPAEDEPWPFAVKLVKSSPRPNLEFNPAAFTYISTHVRNNLPYGVVKEKPRVLIPLRAEDIRHIRVKPGNHTMAQPISYTPDQLGGHIVARPR